MKKIIFIVISTILFITNVKAFDIDVDKIDVNSKADELTTNLNKMYNIEVAEFNNEIIYDEKVQELTRDLVKISVSNDDTQTKIEKFTKYMLLGSTNGFDTLTGSMAIKMYLEKIESLEIEAEYIKDIKTVVFNENDAMSFAYIPDAKINGEEKELILAFWLKEDRDEYRVYFPWLTIDDDLNEYYKKVTNGEDNGEIIGGTFKQVALNNQESMPVSDEVLNRIYQNNKNMVVQITGMTQTGSNMYGSGFFIREGVVVTTWSLFLKFLTNSNYLYVNDVEGNTYNILGVVAAQTDYDVVVLKIDKNVGTGVTFGTTEDLKVNDKLFMINSKNNAGFSINYGSFISLNSGRMKNMFLLNNSDVGAALFNQNGNIVGINVQDLLNSELSYANSTDYLKRLQDVLNSQKYENITYTLVDTFKQKYYTNLDEEKVFKNIKSDIWNKYRNIGKIENNITLPLVKSSYVDGIVSLRYKNKANNLIDSIYLIADFTEELVNEGYVLTYEDQFKKIYKNKDYKIIIKSNMSYLIILIMEI